LKENGIMGGAQSLNQMNGHPQRHTFGIGAKLYPESVLSSEDDESYGGSLTEQLAETAVGVREMSKQLGECLR
jgi:NAD+ kinase